jgi:hypothetical protein
MQVESTLLYRTIYSFNDQLINKFATSKRTKPSWGKENKKVAMNWKIANEIALKYHLPLLYVFHPSNRLSIP